LQQETQLKREDIRARQEDEKMPEGEKLVEALNTVFVSRS
jgi:hypothetical protein